MVEAAIEHHRRELKRNPVNYLLEGYGYEDEARKWAGKYFGVAPEQVALTENQRMIKVGILSATGYMGGEVLRVLLDHPEVEIAWLTGRSRSPAWRLALPRLYCR